jgi:hypothetical protein
MMTRTSGARRRMMNFGFGCRPHRGRTRSEPARYGLDVGPVGTPWTGATPHEGGRNGGGNE